MTETLKDLKCYGWGKLKTGKKWYWLDQGEVEGFLQIYFFFIIWKWETDQKCRWLGKMCWWLNRMIFLLLTIRQFFTLFTSLLESVLIQFCTRKVCASLMHSSLCSSFSCRLLIRPMLSPTPIVWHCNGSIHNNWSVFASTMVNMFSSDKNGDQYW